METNTSPPPLPQSEPDKIGRGFLVSSLSILLYIGITAFVVGFAFNSYLASVQEERASYAADKLRELNAEVIDFKNINNSYPSGFSEIAGESGKFPGRGNLPPGSAAQ